MNILKQSLFLYAFVLLLLLNFFSYFLITNKNKNQQNKLTFENKKLKDSLEKTNNRLLDANYFNLVKNEKAQNYFETSFPNKTIKYEYLIPLITDQLMDYNKEPNGNPYTGQTKIGINKFIINKILILNHRWIIADFSDGEYWGEVLLKYFLEENNNVSFQVVQTLLYQK